VVEAIAGARRLLNHLGAEPASPLAHRGSRVVAGLLAAVLGVWAVSAFAMMRTHHRWSTRSAAMSARAQVASSPGGGADPRLSSAAAPPHDSMVRGADPPVNLAGMAASQPPYSAAVQPLLWPPTLLATAGGSVTHDPRELLARAERLADAGADLSIRQTQLSRVSLPVGGSIQVVPVSHEGRPIGVRLSQLGALLEDAGLESGDLVTSVNGYTYPEDPRRWLEPFIQPSGNAVIEVLRGKRRVVLSVRWR
jgi:hypothetical protein